jgi:hypothetical protein
MHMTSTEAVFMYIISMTFQETMLDTFERMTHCITSEYMAKLPSTVPVCVTFP